MNTSLRSAALAIVSALLASTAFAEAWNQPAASSTYKWFDPANWNPASVPNGVGADANIPDAGNTRTVSLQGAVTLGSIEYNITGIRSFVIANGAAASADGDFNGDGVIDAADYVALRKGGTLVNDPNPGNYTADYDLWRSRFGTVIPPAPPGLTFDAPGAGPATITTTEGAAGTTGKLNITATMHLNDNLQVTVNAVPITSGFDGSVRLEGDIDGPGGITRLGGGTSGTAFFTMTTGVKSYTGPTVLAGGRNGISAGAAPSNSSSFTISGSADLEPSTNGQYQLGAGDLILNGNLTGQGATGIIRPDRNGGGKQMTILNNIVLQSTALLHSELANGHVTPTPGNGFGDGYIELRGNISGAGALAWSSPGTDPMMGTLFVEGTNIYQGGTIAHGGAIVVGNGSGSYPDASLGTGNVTIESATGGGRTAYLEIDDGVLNAIADSATLSLGGGYTAGVADNGYAFLGQNINEKVGGLILGGVAQTIAGTYGSSSSGATFQNDEYFAGSGKITLAFAGAGSTLRSGAVPEPSTIALAGMLASLALLHRRQR
jgi:hypothetical protein